MSTHYQIGEFAELGGVSAKTLRFYDEIGVLRPASVDPRTGYRRYLPKQWEDLASIIALKNLGVSSASLLFAGISRQNVDRTQATQHSGARTRGEREGNAFYRSVWPPRNCPACNRRRGYLDFSDYPVERIAPSHSTAPDSVGSRY